MKGLKEYIRKHGKHFTERLAYDVVLNKRWKKKQIEASLYGKVWYNVTGSTIGDIIYLANKYYNADSSTGYNRKNRCISSTLVYVEDYRNYGGKLFEEWLKKAMQCDFFKEGFDFTSYI